ncbi:MAG: GDP-mannose 4,6-dehydratase [Ferrimicrobium sp.]
MQILVTGSRGFVGQWLVGYLRQEGDEVVELDAALDLRDREALHRALLTCQVDACFHLAAISHVGTSWENPELVYATNVVGTANLVDALGRMARPPTLLFVSSSEVYGAIDPCDLPIVEEHPLAPVSPYAASKVAGEFVALQRYYGRGYPTVVARSFNHTGAGQSRDFVIPGFAARLLAAKASGSSEFRVGNLATRRDFSDVRDVVRAYRALVVRGVAGRIYNVCSGVGVSMDQLVAELSEYIGVKVDPVVDASLIRPADAPVIVGSPERLRDEIGFIPEYSIRETLSAVVDALQRDG